MVIRCSLREGQQAAGEEAIRDLVYSVKTEEPGALAYGFYRSIRDPADVLLVETYRDESAAKAHNNSAHMSRFRSRFAELFDPETADLLHPIASFSRTECQDKVTVQ